MTMLVFNAGSTSIRPALFDLQLRELCAATVSGLGSGMARLRTGEGGEVYSSDLGTLDFAAATAANSAHGRTISSAHGRVKVSVLQTNEEVVIAAKTLAAAAVGESNRTKEPE